MPYLTAAVVLFGLLSLINLALTLGLLRRLRDHGGRTVPPAGPPVVLTAGSRPGSFSTATTDDEPVSDSTISGLVGFFSAHCQPCHALVPRFCEEARELGRHNVLAVIGGADPELVEALTPVARVITEDIDGPVSTAFQNTWTPALYLLGTDGTVVATGGRIEDLAVAMAR